MYRKLLEKKIKAAFLIINEIPWNNMLASQMLAICTYLNQYRESAIFFNITFMYKFMYFFSFVQKL